MATIATLLRQLNRRRLTLLVATLLSFNLVSIQPTYRFDKVWSDFVLTQKAVPIASDFIVIEISDDDLRAYGGPPLSRRILADLLDHIHAADPQRILMDFAFVSETNAVDDAALTAAFNRYGRSKLAISAGLGRTHDSLPTLVGTATLTELRLRSDRDGRLRSIHSTQETGLTNPAYWLATGAHKFEAMPIDLRFDPKSITRLSVSQALAAPYSAFARKRIVITTQVGMSYNHVTLPFQGVVGRGDALVMAAQAYDQGYAKNIALNRLVLAGSILFFAISGLLAGFTIQAFKSVIVLGVLTSALSLFLSIVTLNLLGTPALPLLLSLIFWSNIVIALSARFQISEVFGTFFKGDLSPEEAWLWSNVNNAGDPAFLISSTGKIKRANPAALALDVAANVLIRAAMPRLGHRQSHIEIELAERTLPASYDIIWPHESISLMTLKDVSRQKQEAAQLRSALRTDTLTGALNRYGFEEALDAVASVDPLGYGVFFIDMNGFKAVNDSYGHDVGDALLKAAVDLFSKNLQPGDQICRLGGDEFSILVKRSMTVRQAEAYAQDLERMLYPPLRIDTVVVEVGAAIGFGLPQSAADTPEAVMRSADQMMYARKRLLKSKTDHAA